MPKKLLLFLFIFVVAFASDTNSGEKYLPDIVLKEFQNQREIILEKIWIFIVERS